MTPTFDQETETVLLGPAKGGTTRDTGTKLKRRVFFCYMSLELVSKLRPIELLKDFWNGGQILGLATGKQRMFNFYTSHGYREQQMKMCDPEQVTPEPNILSSLSVATHKVEAVSKLTGMNEEVNLWMGVDVLTATSRKDPFSSKNDVEWDYHLKPDRTLDVKTEANHHILEQELVERYEAEFWSLWEMTWAVMSVRDSSINSMSISVIGHYPEGLPASAIRRSMKKNPELAYKIGPGVDLASYYKKYGSPMAEPKCVKCSGNSTVKLENKFVKPSSLVQLVVFRYLTQHQMGGLMVQFERQ